MILKIILSGLPRDQATPTFLIVRVLRSVLTAIGRMWEVTFFDPRLINMFIAPVGELALRFNK